jgi:transposase
MGNPAGVKRDFDVLERRRLRAAKLLEKGLSEAEVARQVGVHRQSVNRWKQQMDVGGQAALKKAGRAGRKPLLNQDDRKRIVRGLKQGPEAIGYSTGLWTAKRVADLIEKECGVRYSTGHVWLLLGELGWSCQRPKGRALERDEAAIRRWKRKRWPRLKKTLKSSDKP